jgi:hypothetical protein
MHGEPGYNTDTGEPLWPFPFEDVIRNDMRTYQGPPLGTRGFCADGQTLTNYIWSYLGTLAPPMDPKFYTDANEEAVIDWEQALPLSGADRAAGVVREGWATLGCRKKYQSRRVRVVELQTAKGMIRLVSDCGPERLSAELIARLYRQRWEVELFFRWIKCTLGCRHWLAESERGVRIQLYLALIASVLLQLATGRRPNKRMLELFQMYQLGWASLEELLAGVEREEGAARRQKAK